MRKLLLLVFAVSLVGCSAHKKMKTEPAVELPPIKIVELQVGCESGVGLEWDQVAQQVELGWGLPRKIGGPCPLGKGCWHRIWKRPVGEAEWILVGSTYDLNFGPDCDPNLPGCADVIWKQRPAKVPGMCNPYYCWSRIAVHNWDFNDDWEEPDWGVCTEYTADACNMAGCSSTASPFVTVAPMP